ncbi:MAG TPA: bifunctional UDP-N-acetylglucosamine diphosphorylase/glucosamine-1-phosphate N-acetyltransferase GlmU [Bacillota bacterium]|nr:bifunctional UDP-N-acetylglucosamine diphosphorylase/glucosamine-1-phosphate N-acetyltransferase GlmU [Bacillota bacterium]HQD05550.1 bifunctional UDP-N-acetylglucosamine diphosphorylase/glucosamine-1-phosphate N-acetyltransferase GlmU [Bacillota bacterium]
MEQLWAVVLAAGEGKRMRSSLPKVLHRLCGRPMLEYVLDAVAELTGQILIVVGHGAEKVQETIGPRWSYVLQEKQLGTGHAVQQAMPFLPEEGRLLVLCGDTPLLEGKVLARMLQEHGSRAATVMTARVPHPAGYGRIVRRDDGSVARIVEDKDAAPAEKAIAEINCGAYCFDLRRLRQLLPRLEAANRQGEYYLTDIIAMMVAKGWPVGAFQIEDYRVGLGVNDRVHLAEAAALCRERINGRLMREGVTIIDPSSTYIDYRVQVGADTVIWPQTVIEGDTVIGAGCRIGPGAYLRQAHLSDGVAVIYSVVEESTIEEGATVGPFAHIHPGKRPPPP